MTVFNLYVSGILYGKLELDPANPEYILTKWGVGYYLKNS